MSRREFPAKVKEQAYERANGFCEIPWCAAPLHPGKYHYDHVTADGIGGEPTLSNCAVICIACHRDKTKKDVKAIAKTKRIRRRQIGIRKPRKITKWRRFDGSIVRADRER